MPAAVRAPQDRKKTKTKTIMSRAYLYKTNDRRDVCEMRIPPAYTGLLHRIFLKKSQFGTDVLDFTPPH